MSNNIVNNLELSSFLTELQSFLHGFRLLKEKRTNSKVLCQNFMISQADLGDIVRACLGGGGKKFQDSIHQEEKNEL